MAYIFRGPKVFWALSHVFKRPKILDPNSCFLRPRIFGSWLMFSEDQGFFGLWLMFSEDKRFWILAHVFRGLRFLGLGSSLEDQGFFGLWLMFSEDQRFRILTHVFRDLGFLDLGSCFQRTKGFLGFGSCFQRTKGSKSWLMF